MSTIVDVAMRLEKVMELILGAGRVHARLNRELQADEGGPRTAIPSRKNVGGDSEFLAKSHDRGLS